MDFETCHKNNIKMIISCVVVFVFLNFSGVQAELQLTGNNKVYAIDGSLVSVGVTYTGVDTTKRLWAVINADSDISINGTINTLHKNGSVSISSSITNSLQYGTYKMTLFLLYDTGVQENVTTALFYEKNMTGLTMSKPVVETLVNTETTLEATLVSGSDTTVEWISNMGSQLTFGTCDGSVDKIETIMIFPSAQNYSVTLLTLNTIGQNYSGQVDVVVWKPVEGFSLTISPTIAAVNETVTFKLLLDNANRYPMGNIFFNLSYADGSIENVLHLNNYISDPTTGINFNHIYTKQGNYIVDSHVYASLSNQILKPTALVWNQIVLPSAVTYIQISKTGVFHSDYVSITPFNYSIDYGDGRPRKLSPANIIEKNLPLTVGEWDTYFDTEGVYLIVLEGWNAQYYKNCTYTIKVQNPIPNLDLFPKETNPLARFPALQPGVNFTISMTNAMSLPPTNMSCTFCFNSSTCSGDNSVDFKSNATYMVNNYYSTIGEKNITVNCSNDISYKIITTRIEMLPGIQGFKVTNGYTLNFMTNNSATSVFSYTQGAMLSVKMKVHATSVISIDGTVDETNQNGSVVITKDDMTPFSYGTYKVTLELTSESGEVQTIILALFHEQPVTGFLVEEDKDLLLINTDTKFNVTFVTGSNMEVEIVVNETESILLLCSGPVNNFNANYLYYKADNYNISSTAKNALSRASSEYQLVIVVKPVEGFKISTNDNLIDSYTSANLIITLDNSSRLPMYDLWLYLDYGDNSTSGILPFDNDDITSSLSQNGYSISHQYIKQGNYQITGYIKSNLSSRPLQLDFYVWDDITNVRLQSNQSAKVDEEISFSFINVPKSGFEYLIEYGDNVSVQSSPDIVNEDYVDTVFTHSYSSPDVYEVQVTLWNAYYRVMHSYLIIIQHPIVDFYLSPRPPIQYPLPDGEVIFKVNMTDYHPVPTNVTCQFSYENGKVAYNDSVVIRYNKDIKRTHIYTTDGTKNIEIICSNIVSNVKLTTKVEIKAVELDDFTFTYEHIVPMNMTQNATDVPVEVEFDISLFECVRFPPEANFSWYFGDNTDIEINSANSMSHIYELRNSYTITVVIQNSTSRTNKSFSIKIGAVDYTVNSYLGGVGITQFIFEMTGIGVGGTYELFPDLGDTITRTQSQNDTHVQIYKIYNDYGIFSPKIIAINENFTEFLYFPKPLVVDYNMTVLKIEMPNTLRMPHPGKVNVTASLHGTTIPLPLTSCTYDMQDFINFTVVTLTQNITVDDPLIFTFTYLTLGDHDVTVNCSNYYDNFHYSSTITVTNKCFTIEGIFDRQYARPTTPMTVYTTENFDLTNRMGIHCSNESVTFQWKIYRYYSENNKEVFNNNGNDVGQENKGSYRFGKGNVPAGLYEVNLNVSLTTTWIPERTYIRFVQTPPIAFIEGGYQRTSKLSNRYVKLDALTSSFDVGLGYGGNENLNFTWTCYGTNATDLDDLAEKYENGNYTTTPCILDEISRGIANLTLESVQGYIISVNVTSDTVFADYTQLTMAIDGNAPDIYIRCKLNCDKKYAVTAKSIWEVVCIDCVGHATYFWELQSLNEVGKWLKVHEYKTDTGVLQNHFEILRNILIQNVRYRITVSVTDSNGVGRASWKFRTNQIPYGGICKATNKSVLGRPPKSHEIEQVAMPSGKAFSTKFAIYCFDWKDEGDRQERDEVEDRKQNIIPLMYEYVTSQYLKTSNDHDLSKETSIYKGGESTATDLRLPAGSPDSDYTIVVYVKIIDRFGDYAKVNWTFNVTKDENYEPSTMVGAINLFDEYDVSHNTTKAGGNAVSVLRLISATASMYSDITLVNETDSTTDDEPLLVKYAEEPTNDIKKFLQEKTKDFIAEILCFVPPNNTIKVLPADAQLIASTIDECISNPDVLTQISSEGVTNTTYELMQNIQNISKANPYPMSELGAIKGATLDVIDVLSKNLKFLENVTIEDLNTTLSLEVVEADLREYLLYHPEDVEKYPVNSVTIQKLYEERKEIRNKQMEAGASTDKTSEKLFGAIDTINNVNSLTVSYGEGVKQDIADNLNLSIEKDSVDHFINNSILERDGFNFEMNSETFENISAVNVDVQVTVLKKSPLIHADGASKIHGKVVRFTAYDDQDTELQLPLTMTIQNEGVTYYTEFDSSIFEDEVNGLMHFRMQLQDHNDAIIAYLLPDGFDKSSTETYNLTLFATATISSTVGEHEFQELISPLNWTPYGFKIFIPSRTFPQGDIVLSLQATQVPPNNTESESLSRKKRSVPPDEKPANNQTLTNISIAVVTTGCRVYDESTASWNPNGCTVLPFSTINETLCRCPSGVGKIFTSSFFIPNLIDFHSVWSKFDVNNAAIYGTLIALFVLYIIGIIILRRYDKKDQIKWMPMLLCGNQKSANYFYLISVYTGLRPGSGTKSNVSFILGGEDHDSGIRLLSDGVSEGLESKTVKSFVMATTECLGGLDYLRIWHDNSGEGDDASWYLHKIVVDDLQNKERFVFLCDRWLALDLDDGMIDRLCPVVDKDNAGFDTLFSQQTRSSIAESHLWLSIVVRPQRSLFTRVQRLSCLMSLLLLTMITNAMFFRSSSEETVMADTVMIGKLRLSLRALYISVVGILITVPPIMFMTYLFKNSKTRKIIHENDKSNKNKTDDGVETAKTKSREIQMEEQAKYPHWVVYIAWIVVALSIVVPAFFMILFSMEWGKSKSEEWLTTFVLSFVESLLVVDPMKVLLIALIVAWLIKRPTEDLNYSIDLKSVRDKCQSCADDDHNQFLSFRMEVMSKSSPPVEDALQGQRIQRMKEKIAQKAFIEVILQILFAIIVFSISYVNRDERAFRLKNNIDNFLYRSTKTQFGFSKIVSQQGFVNWTKETFIPFMYPTKAYNGDNLRIQDTYYVADLENARVGLVRFRQVRANEVDCMYSAITGDHICVQRYHTDKENKSTIMTSGTLTYTSNAWMYISAESIWGIPIIGLYNTYGGGGFIQTLHNQKVVSENIVDELLAHTWIDRYTRAVFVEFSLYNPNVNIFSYSIYLAEFSENGGAYNWADTQCFRASTITDATGVLSILLYIIFLIIILVMTVKLVNKFRHDGFKKTLTSFWNVLDIVLCVFSYTGTVIWVFKYYYTNSAMKKYYDNKNEFINFQHIVVWEYLFTCILGILCFTATLRILSALSYNKKLTEVALVLRKGAKPISQFAILFMCVFFNFVGFGYLLFGSTVYEYRNIFIALGSLTNTLIGRNSLDSMLRAAPNFAELYFFVYVFFVIFTLLTMFAAILNDSIAEARCEKAPDTIGIVQVIKTVLKDILGVAGIRMKNATANRTTEKYKVKQQNNNGIDASNILGLIRETLDGFEKDKAETEDNTKDKPDTVSDTRLRPLTASKVRIILPDDTEVKDDEDFYNFYKGYI